MASTSDRGRARGRGRARPTQPLDNDETRPGGAAQLEQSQLSSNVELITGAGESLNPALPSQTSIPTQSSASTTEKPRRGAPVVMKSAPRGTGLSGLVPEFAALNVGRSNTRSVPYTSSQQIQQQSIEKRGTSGDPIQLIANYIRILATPTWELFQYHIDFQPEVEQRKMRRELIAQHRDLFKDVAFDGTTMYAFDDLGDEKSLMGRNPGTGQEIQILLKKTAKNSPESPNFFHLANLIVRKLLELTGMKLIGRNYYQYDRKLDLERYKLTLFPGFMTNVNIFEGSLMINVDLSHKILNKTTVYQRLQDIFNQQRDYKKAQDLATKELVGEIVLTTYNNKTYKIDEIAWDQDPTHQFQMRDGSQWSFMKYYQEKYQLQIDDPAQPLLVSKPSKRDRRAGITTPLLLIPELCCVTGISDVMRSDFMFMKEMASHTHVDPATRYGRLNEFINDIHSNPECQKELNKWNIRLDDELVQFESRVLDAEQILYADRIVKYNYEEADWSREGRSLRHINPKNLIKWIVLYPSKEQEITYQLVDALNQVCTPFGMEIKYPDMTPLPNDRSETYYDALAKKVRQDTELVVCILSNNRKDRYDTLKKYLCLDNPVPSQMVLTKTISRKNQLMSVATKIGIQLNAKLGGEIWGVSIPTKTLMVIGMDSYHDLKRRTSSVGAFVASTNQTLTKFYSRIIYQRTTQELMDGLTQCLTDALKEYHRNNNCLPEKIVLYRDGVSDGQLAIIAEHELPQIVETFPKIMPGYEPKLAVVIVKKRGNARFFQRSGRSILNPAPGTIIDHTVTNTDWYDFYLISQCARQGTVSPTHYNVIWDRTNFKVDHMQRLTYKLCHLYYNWPGTIRVPAVCQYAHKLAYLVGQSLNKEFNLVLADKLFYL